MRLEKGAHHATKRRKHGHGLFAQQRNKFKTGQSLTGNETEMLPFSFLWGKGGPAVLIHQTYVEEGNI